MDENVIHNDMMVILLLESAHNLCNLYKKGNYFSILYVECLNVWSNYL